MYTCYCTRYSLLSSSLPYYYLLVSTVSFYQSVITMRYSNREHVDMLLALDGNASAAACLRREKYPTRRYQDTGVIQRIEHSLLERSRFSTITNYVGNVFV